MQGQFAQSLDRLFAMRDILDAALDEQAPGLVERHQVVFAVPFGTVRAAVAPFADRSAAFQGGLDGFLRGNVGRGAVVLAGRGQRDGRRSDDGFCSR